MHIFPQSDVQVEAEQLGLELMNTGGMYNRAFEDLVHGQNEVSIRYSRLRSGLQHI